MAGGGITDRGQLRPDDDMVRVYRAPLSTRYADLARQVWVPQWSIPRDHSITVPVLSFPAINVVIGPDDAALRLPSPGLGTTTLTGTSWTCGLLLRAGAGRLVLGADLHRRHEAPRPVPHADELMRELRATIPRTLVHDRAALAAHAFERWLEPLLSRVDDETRLVNAIVDAAEHDLQIATPRDLVERFGLTERTLQRLALRRIGLTPRWLIQRRRLQAAAYRLRTDPTVPIAEVALDSGYCDQSHFTREFRAVLGSTPAVYRRASSGSTA